MIRPVPLSRRVACTLLQQSIKRRAFHATRPVFVRVGERIPEYELIEDSPGNKVNLSKELAQGKGLIIGVPAAFSKWILTLSKPYYAFARLGKGYRTPT